MSIQNIGVIGAGQMGNGIAHVFAQAGYQVLMQDLTEGYARKGLATIDKNLQRGVDKGKMTAEEKAAVLDPREADDPAGGSGGQRHRH